MSKRTVTVKIELPRSLHSMMKIFADLAGRKTKDWYTLWLIGNFEAFSDQFPKTGIEDMKDLAQLIERQARR